MRKFEFRTGIGMGFSHAFCSTCKEERLHHKQVCVSCKTPQSRGRYKRGDWGEFQVKKRKKVA